MHSRGFEADRNRSIEDQIGEIIIQRHENMLQVISAELNNTFLAIGQQLQGRHDKQIANLASRLETSFGTFFTLSKLHSIKRVVAAMPDPVEWNMVVDMLDWEQLSFFADLEDKESRFSFLQSLFHDEKKKKITIQSNEKIVKRNLIKPEYYKAVEALKKEFFRKDRKISARTSENEIFTTLRLIMEIKINSSMLNKEPGDHRLEKSILALIEKFSLRINSWLNSFLNFSFLEIGKRLNALLSEDNNPEKIENISADLMKKFRKPFDAKNLADARRFAAFWNNQDKILELASSVTWSHIRVLPLENVNYSLLYATLASSRQWLAETLFHKIQDETERRQLEPEPDFSLTVIKTSNRSKKGNHIIEKNTAHLEKAIPPFSFSIFENPYFPLIDVERQQIRVKNILRDKRI